MQSVVWMASPDSQYISLSDALLNQQLTHNTNGQGATHSFREQVFNQSKKIKSSHDIFLEKTYECSTVRHVWLPFPVLAVGEFESVGHVHPCISSLFLIYQREGQKASFWTLPTSRGPWHLEQYPIISITKHRNILESWLWDFFLFEKYSNKLIWFLLRLHPVLLAASSSLFRDVVSSSALILHTHASQMSF